MLDALSAAVGRHGDDRSSPSEVPRLSLVALDEFIAPTDLLYDPMICFVADGAKRVTTGPRSITAGRGEMFLNLLEVPVTAMFEQVPYRSAVLRLDARVLADLLLELAKTEEPQISAGSHGQMAVPMSPQLVDAVTRWVQLLDAPEDIGALAERVEGEILYRLLSSPLGPALRQFALADSAVSRVREAAAWICAHYAEPLSVEAIAAVAHMSPATLHRRFKAATGRSPLQFQKHVRLQEARRQLVAGETTAAWVAEAVGYLSATQFNREYRRAYGLPPARDAARLRDRLARTQPTASAAPPQAVKQVKAMDQPGARRSESRESLTESARR